MAWVLSLGKRGSVVRRRLNRMFVRNSYKFGVRADALAAAWAWTTLNSVRRT